MKFFKESIELVNMLQKKIALVNKNIPKKNQLVKDSENEFLAIFEILVLEFVITVKISNIKFM